MPFPMRLKANESPQAREQLSLIPKDAGGFSPASQSRCRPQPRRSNATGFSVGFDWRGKPRRLSSRCLSDVGRTGRADLAAHRCSSFL
jgi:hypothetical protein